MTSESLKNLTTDQLEQAVHQRRELVEQIFRFVISFLREYGEVKDRDVSSDHIRITRELKRFEGFSFRCATGKNVYGGEDVEIRYHDPEQDDADPEVVFDVYFQTEYSARVFAEGEWQPKLNYLMEHLEEVVARVREEKELEQERIQEERTEALRVAGLREEAARLRL